MIIFHFFVKHQSNADYMFGGVTAVCGILGSIAGGLVLDRMSSTLPNAFKVSLHSLYI